jgi:hypothetical protein
MGSGVPTGETQPPLSTEAAREKGISEGRYAISPEAGLDLSEHVGKRVELTGTVEDTRAAGSTTPESAAGPRAGATAASNTAADAEPTQTLNAEKVREIASSCR